jgi:hypothetical protein
MSIKVRKSLAGLKALWSAKRLAPAAPAAKAEGQVPAADSEIARGTADGSIRMEKVAPVQAALAAGTYSVPARAVAAKMVDAMLAGEQMRMRNKHRRRPAADRRQAGYGRKLGGSS